MNLPRDSRFVRFAYWTRGSLGVPDRTSLCAFFWRAFVIVPIVTAVLLFLAGVLTYFAVAYWRDTLKVVGVASGILAGIIALALCFSVIDTYVKKRAQREPRLLRQPSVFIAGLKTLKGKVCPLIEFR